MPGEMASVATGAPARGQVALGRPSDECSLVIHDGRPTLTLARSRAQAVDALLAHVDCAECLLARPTRILRRDTFSRYVFPPVDPVTHVSEWPVDLWVDATGRILELCDRLFHGGRYCFRSLNSFALQLMSGQAVYLDLSSVSALTPRGVQATTDSLWRCLLRPLVLATNGNGRLARVLLLHSGGVSLRELDEHQGLELEWRARTETASAARKIAELRRVLEAVIPMPTPGPWSDYGRDPDTRDRALWDVRRRVVSAVMEDLHACSVIDLGCNAGWFSHFSALQGARAVAVDREDDLLNAAWRKALRSGAVICPLWIDLAEPALSVHWASAPAFPTAPERLRSELSIWLALVHHLTLGAGLSFTEVAALVRSYTTRAALVEFVDGGPDNPFTWTHGRTIPHWYSIANFMRHLQEEFARCELLPEPKGNRRLILCGEPRRECV